MFPAQLGGFVLALLGMAIGSLGPQTVLRNRHGSHHHIVGIHS